TIINAIPLPIPGFQQPGCRPGFYCFPTAAYGSDVLTQTGLFNDDLKQEETTAWEVGYTGQIGDKTTIGVGYYINDTNNIINFTPFLFYSSQNPPPGWPLPPIALDFPPLKNVLPAVFTYLNLGPLREQGIELSWDQIINSRMSCYANYSWQKDPEILTPDTGQI